VTIEGVLAMPIAVAPKSSLDENRLPRPKHETGFWRYKIQQKHHAAGHEHGAARSCMDTIVPLAEPENLSQEAEIVWLGRC